MVRAAFGPSGSHLCLQAQPGAGLVFPSLGCILKTKQEAGLSLGSPKFPFCGGFRAVHLYRGRGEGFPSGPPPPRVALRWSTAVEMNSCAGCFCGSAISVYLRSVRSSCLGSMLGLSVPVALQWGRPLRCSCVQLFVPIWFRTHWWPAPSVPFCVNCRFLTSAVVRMKVKPWVSYAATCIP